MLSLVFIYSGNFLRGMGEWWLNNCQGPWGRADKNGASNSTEQDNARQGGDFFPPLFHVLKLTQIKDEKKKDTVFLNIIHHILKTDCTEHYHAHNKPYLLERLPHWWWFFECFLSPLPEQWIVLLSHRVICLVLCIYQTAWWRIDNPFLTSFFFLNDTFVGRQVMWDNPMNFNVVICA